MFEHQHTPLPDPRTHIRLLKILKGSVYELVKCALTAWPLDTAPSFYAVSYTWGEPSDLAVIVIDAKCRTVRRSCEYVLQQAYASGVDTYYWIDAICIDQTNTNEKNYQVAMMGERRRLQWGLLTRKSSRLSLKRISVLRSWSRGYSAGRSELWWPFPLVGRAMSKHPPYIYHHPIISI